MRNKLLATPSLNTDLATFVLRLLFGGLFAYYGYMKVEAFDQVVPMFKDYTGLGAKGSFILLIFAELVCGVFVLIGFFTRLSIIPIFIAMNVAYWDAHKNDPFNVKQIVFVYIVLCIVIFILGSGRYSVDRLLFKK